MSTAATGASYDSSAPLSSRRSGAMDRRSSLVMRREHSSSLRAFVNSHESTVTNSLRLYSSRIGESSLAIPEEQEYAESNGNSSVLSNMDDIYDDDKNPEKKSDFMHRVCLKSNYTLKSQLLMSFGFMNFAVICVVVLICIMVTIFVGDDYKEINADTFSSALGQGLQGRTARYLAESLQHRLLPVDYVNLLFEMTRDRFAGYPDALFSNDPPIPFANLDGAPREYPIIGPPIPLDWELKEDNFQLNDRVRREWYLADQPVSTEYSDFFFQGACDPSISDPNNPAYYAGCTDANNDISTGGIVNPSNYTEAIYERAKDLAPILKAMFEYNADIFEVGVFFANQGAGASIKFPQKLLDATNLFISEGCDWLNSLNPMDPSRPILNNDLTENCPAKGEPVKGRDYNPLIREWCQRQALDPDQSITVDGPYLDAFVEGNWLLSFGKAVFDPYSNEFVACTYVAIQVNFAESILKQAILSENSQISVTRFDPNATVVASSAFSIADANRVSFISEWEVGLTDETYNDLYTLVDYELTWNPADVKEAYQQFFTQAHGYAVTAHPIPPVPDSYDERYRPEYLAIVSISEADVLAAVEQANDDVDDEVRDTVIFAVIVGGAGFAFSMVVLLVMASLLTLPLNEMNRVASEIVESFGHRSADTNVKLNIEPVKDERWVAKYCLPRTEILTLTERFNSMVKSFSGSLMTRSKKSKEIETPSCYKSSHELLGRLYRTRKDLPFPLDFEDEEQEEKEIEPKSTTLFSESTSNGNGESETLSSPTTTADEHTIVFEVTDTMMGGGEEASSARSEHQESLAKNVDNTAELPGEMVGDKGSEQGDDCRDEAIANSKSEADSSLKANEAVGPISPSEEKVDAAISVNHVEDERMSTIAANGEVKETEPQIAKNDQGAEDSSTAIGKSYENLTLDEDAPMSSVFVPEGPASEEWDRPLVNMGRNLIVQQSQRGKSSSMVKTLDAEKRIRVKSWGLRSPLFLWIVLLIIIPLLVTSILISAVVFATIRDSFVDSVRNSEDYFLSIEEFAMGVTAGLRAEFIASSSERAAADLYFMKRYAEWLLFGALERSRPFPRVMTGLEECKNGDNATIEGCTWARDNYVCDCDWNWPDTQECMAFADEQSRKLQTPYFFVSTDNADSNGARSSTLYPSTHVAPDNTSWWASIDVLPGSESGWNASGYMTTYDRLRVMAANPMTISLPNADYDKEVGTTFHFAFEDDGLVLAYDGCQASEHGWSAFWKSSEGNGAADLRPELCPLGKYGYDPRCREWYATGAEVAKNGSGIYITAPYAFADGTQVGQSATSGMIDPKTGIHVGQVLVDFMGDPIFDSLEQDNTKVRPGGFPLMITSISDNFGRDTVVGPGVDRASEGKPVVDLVVPYDVNCTTGRTAVCDERLSSFSEIANAMKNGETGVAEFTRTTQSGDGEDMVIAYAPSIVRFLEPTNSSVFSSGANSLRRVIYSIAIVQTKASILETFEATESDMNDQLKLATWVLVIFLFWAIVLVVWISYQVAHTISEPILYLVETVNSIVSLSDEEPPHLDRSKGSIEIANVSNTVHSLYRAVTLANKFFSAGELEAAYNLLVDALALFQRIDNKKASKLLCWKMLLANAYLMSLTLLLVLIQSALHTITWETPS